MITVMGHRRVVDATTKACAECRRSKLKCDKKFPCQACVRRGCADICPDGALAAVKGNQALAAQAKRLAEQVQDMSQKIRLLEQELENARAAKIAEVYSTPSPGGSSSASSDRDLQRTAEMLGTLSVGSEGQIRYHGETAASECYNSLLRDVELPSDAVTDLGIPEPLLLLAKTFPFGDKTFHNKAAFVSCLPPIDRACQLVDRYRDDYTWMFQPVARSELTILLQDVYDSASFRALDNIHPHRLALLFIVFAMGAPPGPAAARFETLAHAAFALQSTLLTPAVETAQALFLMVQSIRSCDHANIERRWILKGLFAGVAQTLGLQRDGARWGLPRAEVERRRVLWWDMITLMTSMAIQVGRPSPLSIHHTDCRFPEDREPVVNSRGEIELGFHAWRIRFAATCISPVVDFVFGSRAEYSQLLDLDKRMRLFPVPEHLECPLPEQPSCYTWSSLPGHALQQFMVLYSKECNLLFMHRYYFRQAVKQSPLNPLTHQYAPSVLALYRAAVRLICCMKALYAIHPERLRAVPLFWAGVFNACISLGALVVDSPSCALAESALAMLEEGCALYNAGASVRAHPSLGAALQRLLPRAQQAFAARAAADALGAVAVTAQTSRYLRDNLGLPPDELEVLGGTTGVLRLDIVKEEPASQPSPVTPSLLDAWALPPPDANMNAHLFAADASYWAAFGAPDLAPPQYAPTDVWNGGVLAMQSGIPLAQEMWPGVMEGAFEDVSLGFA